MDKTTLATRIRALLAKTQDNGCTEAEAMAAALKARELMDRYHIDHGSIGLEAEGTMKFNTTTKHTLHYTVRRKFLRQIATFCDCRYWVTASENGSTFFGLRSDVEFATWLADNLTQFVLMQSLEFELDGTGRDGNAFMQGCIDRINERLREAAQSRESTGQGNALVVAKSAIVERDFAALGLSLGKSRSRSLGGSDRGAYAAGRSAGNDASFGRPVSSARAALPSR